MSVDSKTIPESKSIVQSVQKKPGLSTPQELKEAGYVLEVTARDPDRFVKNEFQKSILVPGKIFDLYHHPCSAKDKAEGKCSHSDTEAGHWVKIPAEDEKRCVN